MNGTHTLIIGSGPAGAAIAEALLCGDDAPEIVMLEAGGAVTMANQRLWWDHVLSGFEDSPYTRWGDEATDVSDIGPTKMRLQGSRLLARGGSSLHWGAWMPRFQPEDFRLRSLTGRGVDWPISYFDLEPFYCLAERFLQVAGKSSEHVRPPRSQPFPFETPPFGVSDGIVVKALESLGLTPFHIPVSRNTHAIQYPQGVSQKCVTYGTCKYCPIRARYSSDQTLDRLEQAYSQSFDLRTDAVALEVLMSTKRVASGVRYWDKQKDEVHTLDAERVIIAAGAIESPKLLLSSRRSGWTRGLGNDTGHVGRHLVAHPLIQAFGKLTHAGVPFNEINFPTLGCRDFDTPREQRRGKMLMIREHGKPTINFSTGMEEYKTASDLRSELHGEQEFQLDGFVEEFAHPASYVALGRGRSARGVPKTEMHFRQHDDTTAAIAHHQGNLRKVLLAMGCPDATMTSRVRGRRADHLTGTVRMSSNPSDGVVDRDLRVHGTDNVYVCSNAVFASGAASNPSPTLVALAIRLADHMSGGKSRLCRQDIRRPADP